MICARHCLIALHALFLLALLTAICSSYNKSTLNTHWKDWCWSCNSNTLATWCEELTHLKRCWERLKSGGEGVERRWDGWMPSPTQWTCVWVDSGSWWWTGRPGMLHFMGLQRVGHDWVTELNWTDEDFWYWRNFQEPREKMLEISLIQCLHLYPRIFQRVMPQPIFGFRTLTHYLSM